MDGVSKAPSKADNEMKRFVSIIAEGKGPLNRPTQAEQLVTQHYTNKKAAVTEKKSSTSIDKYFKLVEQELLESKKHEVDRKKEKVKSLTKKVVERVTIGPDGEVQGGFKPTAPDPNAPPRPAAPAEPPRRLELTPGVSYPAPYTIAYNGKEYKFAGRDQAPQGQGEIITVSAGAIGIRGLSPVKVQLGDDGLYYVPNVNEVGGNHGHFSKLKTHLSRATKPPEEIVNMAKSGARVDHKTRRNRFNEETEGVDSVTLDIPLMIRLLEFAREDAKDDMILHKVVERMLGMKEEGQSLSMSDYENIVGKVDEACWKDYKQIGMKKKGGKTVPNCVPKK